jgi:hypothetical protein
MDGKAKGEINMANVVDFLKEHKICEHNLEKRNFILELVGDEIHLHIKGNTYKINADEGAEVTIMDVLETEYNIEIRFCETCGKPFDAGYMVEGGWWYCCEDCFDDTMNRDYGEGKWRGTDDEGEYGGYYEYLNDDGEWEDTGIFYTDWY